MSEYLTKIWDWTKDKWTWAQDNWMTAAMILAAVIVGLAIVIWLIKYSTRSMKN